MSTERKIQDYLHFYLGCEVEYVGILNGKEIKEELAANKHDVFYIPKIAEIKGPKRGFLREIRCNQEGQFRMCKVGRRGLKSFWGSSPDFKLILRPLSDMTEDEAKAVYTIEKDRVLHETILDFDLSKRDHGMVIHRLDDLNVSMMMGFDGVCYKVVQDSSRKTIEPALNQPLIFAYLLKQGFDLFNLIPDDLAINKTTLKP